jgi:hypothetical protein
MTIIQDKINHLGMVNPSEKFPENGTVLDQLKWIDSACEFGSTTRYHILRTALRMAIKEIEK